MQFRTTKKIVIDEQKLTVLIRLGCPDDRLLSVIKTGKFEKTGDKIIDEILECLVDRKEFKNWGGNHNPNGINNCKKRKKVGQVDRQDGCQDGGQVVDKDKDKDKDKDNIKVKDKIKYNHYGELNNVCLTEDDYNKLLSIYPDFKEAVEVLDTWLGTSGSKNKNKNHYAYFKSNSWVWDRIKQKHMERRKTQAELIDEHNLSYIEKIMEEQYNG